MHLRQPRVEGAEQVASCAGSFGCAWSWTRSVGCCRRPRRRARERGRARSRSWDRPSPEAGRPAIRPWGKRGRTHESLRARSRSGSRGRGGDRLAVAGCHAVAHENAHANGLDLGTGTPPKREGRPFVPGASEGEHTNRFVRDLVRVRVRVVVEGIGSLLPVATPSRTRTPSRTISILGPAYPRSGKGGHSSLGQARANARVASCAISFGFGFAWSWRGSARCCRLPRLRARERRRARSRFWDRLTPEAGRAAIRP